MENTGIVYRLFCEEFDVNEMVLGFEYVTSVTSLNDADDMA
jgi:hypothetical protein